MTVKTKPPQNIAFRKPHFWLLIASSCSPLLLPFSATANPFAPTPFQVLNSNEAKANPNVLFVIDNSGSMWSIPEVGNVCATPNDVRGSAKAYGRTNSPVCSDYCGYSSSSNKYKTCQSDTPKSRMDMVRSVIQDLVQNPKYADFRWGIGYLNTSNGINLRATPVLIGANNANKILTSIGEKSTDNSGNLSDSGVIASGGTPFTQQYYNHIRDNYLNGNAIQYRCQKNYAIALTDGESNGSRPSIDSRFQVTVNFPNASIPYEKKGQYDWLNNYNGDYGLGYLSKQFAETTLRGEGWSNHAKNDGDNQPWDDPKFNNGKQTITTFTINFGQTNNPNVVKYLSNGAQGEKAQYFAAGNEDELNQAFEDIFNNIEPVEGLSTATPAISSNATSFGYSSLNTGNWASELRFAVMASKGKPLVDEQGLPVYQTAHYPDLKPGGNSRRILLTTGQGRVFFDNEQDFAALINNVSTENQILGINPSMNANTAWKKTYLPWLIKSNDMTDKQINDLAQKNHGLAFRDRVDSSMVKNPNERFMGDVIGASILTLGPTIKDIGEREKYLITAANDGMFYFYKAKLDNDIKDVKDPKFKPYELKLNYLPGAFEDEVSADGSDTLLKKISRTMHPDYGKNSEHPHQYLLNGGMAYAITNKGRHDGQQIFVVGGLGQGARGAYAFNVGGQKRSSGEDIALEHNEQNKWLHDVPLWETNNPQVGNAYQDSQQLGYLVGEGPAIVRLAKNQTFNTTLKQYQAETANNVFFAALISDGMDTGNLNRNSYAPSLYVYDALGQDVGTGIDFAQADNGFNANQVGKLIKKISYTDNDWDNGAAIKGLSSAVGVDVNRDGITDVAYAGDMDGNVYRFDFRAISPDDWKAVLLYKGNAKQPIIAKPTVYRANADRFVVLVGTGTDVFTDDAEKKDEQSFLALYDDINSTDVSKAISKDQLLQQSFTSLEEADGTKLRYSSSHIIDQKVHRGWYIDLATGSEKPTGERVVNQAQIQGYNVYFTSRIYNVDTSQSQQVCSSISASGQSYVNTFNATSGKAPSRDPYNGHFVNQIGKDNLYSSMQISGITSGLATDNPNGMITDRHGLLGKGEFEDINKLSAASENCINGIEYLYLTTSEGKILSIPTDKKCPGAGFKRLSWREIF